MSKFLENCRKGNVNVIQKSINLGHDINLINSDGENGLYIACKNNKIAIVKLLLDKKCFLEKKNKNGTTSLAIACVHGFYDIVELLIKAGANIDSINNTGATPLMLAIMNNQYKIVKKLIEHNANILNYDDRKYTPLIWTCIYTGNEEIVELLLNKGSDVNFQCKEGNCALHYVLKGLFMTNNIYLKLLEYGANPYLMNNNEENSLSMLNNNQFNVNNLFYSEYRFDVIVISDNIIFIWKKYLKKRMDIIREDLCKTVFHPRNEGKLWSFEEEF